MAAVITGVGLVGAAASYLFALHEANSFMDSQLRQVAGIAGPALRSKPSSSGATDPEDNIVVQVWSLDGVLQAVPSDVGIPRQPRVGFASVDVAGTPYRVFTTSDARKTVQVSQQVAVRQELAESAALQAAIPLLFLIPVGLVIVGWAMGRVLADLNLLAAEVERLPLDGREPLDFAHVPREAAPLVVAMNRLIERLRVSLAQQRKFLSDAAHELRTPLTALQLQIGNLNASRSGTTAMALDDLRHGIQRASTLVEQLLRVARYDAAADVRQCIDVDLASIVLAAIADHIALAESRSIDLGITAQEPAPFRGDPSDLRILFGNLIDNALKYTLDGGVVDLAVARLDDTIEVSITDTGPGIDPALLTRVFNRFFRAAPAGIEGSGLGLAICKAIADQHGLTLTLSNRWDRTGLRVAVMGRPHEARSPAPVRVEEVRDARSMQSKVS